MAFFYLNYFAWADLGDEPKLLFICSWEALRRVAIIQDGDCFAYFGHLATMCSLGLGTETQYLYGTVSFKTGTDRIAAQISLPHFGAMSELPIEISALLKRTQAPSLTLSFGVRHLKSSVCRAAAFLSPVRLAFWSRTKQQQCSSMSHGHLANQTKRAGSKSFHYW